MPYDRTPLTQAALEEFLSAHPQWEVTDGALRRSFQFPSFLEAVHFVNRVAKVAEGHHHHPDIDIRYTRVHLSLTTHDAGGLTFRDPLLAAACEQLAR